MKIDINKQITNFIVYCTKVQKNPATIKAYTLDLRQYTAFVDDILDSNSIKKFIAHLQKTYKCKSVKKKIAVLKLFYKYMFDKKIISDNPFFKIASIKDPVMEPKIVPLDVPQKILKKVYEDITATSSNTYTQKTIIMHAAMFELLINTGLKITEICDLKIDDIDFKKELIYVRSPNCRQRTIKISDKKIKHALEQYKTARKDIIQNDSNKNYFFINRFKRKVAHQSVQNSITEYAQRAGYIKPITPNMLRHTLAVRLLKENPQNIVQVKEMFGHGSIITTEKYLNLSQKKS